MTKYKKVKTKKDYKFTLEELKSRFLSKYVDEFYFDAVKMIYEFYETELINQFDKFFKSVLNAFKPENDNDIERNLFEYDVMQNICNLLFFQIGLYQSSYHTKMEIASEQIPIALIHYQNEKERNRKYKDLLKLSDQSEESIFIFFLDQRDVTNIVESLLLQQKIFLRMTKTKSTFISQHYRKQLKKKNNLLDTLKPDAKYGSKMKGRKLHPSTKKMYQRIIALREELSHNNKNKRKSSLLNAVKEYNKIKHKYWSDKKIMSIYETIRQLAKNNKL